jgi:hypothetical protein
LIPVKRFPGFKVCSFKFNLYRYAELLTGSLSAALPRAWAPGARARDRREAAKVGAGPPQPSPLIITCMSTEGAFKTALDRLFNDEDGGGGGGGGGGGLGGGNASPLRLADAGRLVGGRPVNTGGSVGQGPGMSGVDRRLLGVGLCTLNQVDP